MIDEHTFCRRWIRRPDKMIDDPFGQRTVRANMHPGYQNPDAIAPAGPVDPGLDSALGPVARWPADRGAGQLLDALLWGRPVSADYFGRFAAALARRIGATDKPASRHSSRSCRKAPAATRCGWTTASPRRTRAWMPMPTPSPGLPSGPIKSITYHDWVPLAMAETKLVLGRRVPDEQRLAWAKSRGRCA